MTEYETVLTCFGLIRVSFTYDNKSTEAKDVKLAKLTNHFSDV